MKKNYLLFLLGSIIIIFSSNLFIAQDTPKDERVVKKDEAATSEFQVSDNPVIVSDDISDENTAFQTQSINWRIYF